jgi:hypothetical protein
MTFTTWEKVSYPFPLIISQSIPPHLPSQKLAKTINSEQEITTFTPHGSIL